MKRMVGVFAAFVLSLATPAFWLPAPVWAATDPLRDKQWALDRIDVEVAWKVAKGSGITIAIVDSGIDLDHPDLKSRISSGWNCMDDPCVSGGNDDNGHGTHVAGIAAAATSNGIGVAGVAPSAKLMAVKVLDRNGEGFTSDIARGIRLAVDKGARVVNLSLGPDVPLALDALGVGGMTDAVSYASSKGAVVVAAAGNDALPASFYTGTANLLVVGATGPNDELADYSSAGFGVDVYAPGGNSRGGCDPSDCIVSTYKDGKYASIEGTSMATPHVSGIAALLLGQGRSRSETVSRITSTTEETSEGFPRVNAARAVGAPGGGSGGGGSGGGGSGGGGSGGGGSGGGGGRGGGGSPRPSASATPTIKTTPGGSMPGGGSGSPEPGGSEGPRAGAPGSPGDGPGGGGRAVGLVVLLGITGALFTTNRLRRRA